MDYFLIHRGLGVVRGSPAARIPLPIGSINRLGSAEAKSLLRSMQPPFGAAAANLAASGDDRETRDALRGLRHLVLVSVGMKGRAFALG